MTGEKGHKLLPELLHTTFMVSNTLIYIVIRPVLRFLTVPYEACVPEHTRYALFQLYCDLRANPPRDRHWFMTHARRLRPHTFSGWIALGSALLYLGSGAALLLSSLLSFAIVALYAAMFATISISLVGGFLLGLLAFSLFITSGAAFFGATGAAVGYATLSAAKASLRMLPNAVGRVEVTGPHGLPEAPRLRPVATPRAPVSTLANSAAMGPAVAAATAAPPDPAPASPCRRHATPTAEAFQRAEAAAAVVSPPPLADPVVVSRVSSGKFLGGSPPAADDETLKSAPAAVADPNSTLNPATHLGHHAAAVHARGAGGDATGAGGAAHTSNGEIHTLPYSTPNPKAGHQTALEALAETERLAVSVPKGHVSGTSPKGAAAKNEPLAKGMVADKENRDGVHSADAATAKGGDSKSPIMSVGSALGVR